jgi:hypothetical protein
MQLRSNLNRAFFGILPNMDHLIFMKYKEVKPVHKQIFNIITTDQPFVYTDSFSGLGLMQKKEEGEEGATDQIYQMFSQRYTPYTYALLLEFSEEAVEDDRLGIIKKADIALGTSAAATEDVLACNILNNAFATTGPDGKVLCATDHPLETGTARNRPTTGTDFSHTCLGLALIDWANEQKTYRGQKIESEPSYLVHPADLKLDVAEVLKSTMRSDTANNATNVIKDDYNIQPVTWKRLSDPDAWFLLAKPGQHEINIVVRKSFHTSHGVDDKVGKAWTRGRFRRDQGFSDWVGVWGSPGQ